MRSRSELQQETRAASTIIPNKVSDRSARACIH